MPEQRPTTVPRAGWAARIWDTLRRGLPHSRGKSTTCRRTIPGTLIASCAQGLRPRRRVGREIRRMKLDNLLDSLGRDLRYALRSLPRRPAFTLAVVLTLALGIGTTTAIFSVVYSVLIKPLPFPDSGDLVRIRHSAPGLGAAEIQTSPAMYFTYRKENKTFAEIGLWSVGGETLTSGGETLRIRSLRASHGLLQALGVQPMRGRWFTEQE